MKPTLLTNARIATMSEDSGYGLIESGAIIVEGENIRWVGPASELPDIEDADVIDCHQQLVTPGLIDCHSHLVYAGDRATEFELRLEGTSYEEIARHGGGIISTVNATREASEAELLEQSQPRLDQLMSEGVTTLEIKSGYGLNCNNEIKMLKVARQLDQNNPINIVKTFLGAHALPPEYKDRDDEYISEVCSDMLPKAHAEGLVDAVDIFVESIAFNLDHAKQVFDTAKSLDLPIKAHVEQLSDMGGAVLSAQAGALSVDHIEYLSDEAVAELGQTDTVAVILPGAFYFLRETQLPPIDALRKHGVPMALATDANPGSSPIFSIHTILNMACTLFHMTPSETLKGVTINAAKALGLETRIGSIEAGKQADLVLWNTDNPAMLSAQVGLNYCHSVMQAGKWRGSES